MLLYICIRQHWNQPYHVNSLSPAVYVSMGTDRMTSEIRKLLEYGHNASEIIS